MRKRLAKSTKQYPVVLETEDAGGYVVTCPAFDGCYSQGETIEEALENIREAILLCEEELPKQKPLRREVSLHLVTV